MLQWPANPAAAAAGGSQSKRNLLEDSLDAGRFGQLAGGQSAPSSRKTKGGRSRGPQPGRSVLKGGIFWQKRQRPKGIRWNIDEAKYAMRQREEQERQQKVR